MHVTFQNSLQLTRAVVDRASCLIPRFPIAVHPCSTWAPHVLLVCQLNAYLATNANELPLAVPCQIDDVPAIDAIVLSVSGSFIN